jgi:hypothetical protein
LSNLGLTPIKIAESVGGQRNPNTIKTDKYHTDLTLDDVNPLFSPIRSDFGDVLRQVADFCALHPDIEVDIRAMQTAHVLRKKHHRQLRVTPKAVFRINVAAPMPMARPVAGVLPFSL